jgi:hypothetical protein
VRSIALYGSSMQRIVIVDLYEVVRAGLRSILATEPNWDIVAEARGRAGGYSAEWAGKVLICAAHRRYPPPTCYAESDAAFHEKQGGRFRFPASP